MSRGVRNVLVRDCTFIDSDVGIRFKSALGRGGVVEEIYLRDIQMVNIRKEAVIITMDYVHNQMDYFDAVSTSSDPEDIPEFKNIYFERCICSDESPGTVVKGLEGCPGTVHDVYFKDCRVGSSGHGQQTSGRI
jgi:polygalacturonase